MRSNIILKFFIAVSLFIAVIKLSRTNIHLNFFNYKIFLVVLFSLLISIFLLSLRINIIYNKTKYFKFYQLFLFNLKAWSLSNFFISGTSEVLKIFFFKNLNKTLLFSYIFLEKSIVIFSSVILIILYFIILSCINILNFNLIYLIIFFFLVIYFYLILLKLNFIIQKIPYLNILSFDLNKIIDSFSKSNLLLLVLVNAGVHFVSFFNLLFILLLLKIKLDFLILLILYLFYYLSGILQLFPNGLGIRELLFFLLATFANLNVNNLLNLSILITSLNFLISASIIIIIISINLLKKKKLFNFNFSNRTRA